MRNLEIRVHYNIYGICGGHTPDDLDVPASCLALEVLMERMVCEAYTQDYHLSFIRVDINDNEFDLGVKICLEDAEDGEEESISDDIDRLLDGIYDRSEEWDITKDEVDEDESGDKGIDDEDEE
jgi:hypothetical protein